MNDPCVFFSRCRPRKADPIKIVLQEKRVFIGWPAWKPGREPRKGHLRDAVVDLQCSDKEWLRLCSNRKFAQHRKQYTQNRNFVWSIEVSSIALVPRPERGYVYAGRVIQPFRLFNDPPWGEAYLRFRKESGLESEPETDYLADVAQCWKVDDFRAIPFSDVPAWIRRSLFGRSTYGVIPNLSELNRDAYKSMCQLLTSETRNNWKWTQNLRMVEQRLISQISPNAFEHLCVALLQLENPSQTWVHVGGSGDGGVDGIGVASDGRLIGRLQCKWAYTGGYEPTGGDRVPKQVLASLIHKPDVIPPDGYEFWSRRHIAELVVKHADHLPTAMSMRIGSRQ